MNKRTITNYIAVAVVMIFGFLSLVPATQAAGYYFNNPISRWIVLNRLFSEEMNGHGFNNALDQWDVLYRLFKVNEDGTALFAETDQISQWIILDKLFR